MARCIVQEPSPLPAPSPSSPPRHLLECRLQTCHQCISTSAQLPTVRNPNNTENRPPQKRFERAFPHRLARPSLFASCPELRDNDQEFPRPLAGAPPETSPAHPWALRERVWEIAEEPIRPTCRQVSQSPTWRRDSPTRLSGLDIGGRGQKRFQTPAWRMSAPYIFRATPSTARCPQGNNPPLASPEYDAPAQCP